MAGREFHGIIRNDWQRPLTFLDAGLQEGGGHWQIGPGQVPGAGLIAPGQEGEWRSGSDELLLGTAGHSIWSVGGFRNPNEFLRIGWNVPWIPGPSTMLFTAQMSTSDPRGGFSSGQAPELEIVPTLYEIEDASVPAQVAYLAPYVLAVPWSFFLHSFGNIQEISHPRVKFVLRERVVGTTQSRLEFPRTAATPQDVTVMQSFRHRAELAAHDGFIGAFPTFHEAPRGLDIVGGTILLKQDHAEWRDVPLAELRNVPLGNFGERMRATNEYASRNGFVGGFPNGFHADYGQGTVCGSIVLRSEAAEWRDVDLQSLGNVSLDDIPARFRAVHDYAVREGFVGGFPNLFHATHANDVRFPTRPEGTVCGTILIKQGFGEWRDVVIYRGPA